MTATEHESYAKDLLSSLSDERREIEGMNFVIDRTQSRNAAKAMTAILCQRLSMKSKHQPKHKANTTYEWKEGIFNCRNIADRDYLWTNIRRSVADGIHHSAKNKPVAYLLAFSKPSGTTLSVWAIPEPILNNSLLSLPLKEGGQEYTIQIFTNKQRIEHWVGSPDLAPYFQEFPLSRQELLVLREAREADALVKSERAIARGEENSDSDDGEGDSAPESETSMLLATLAQQLAEDGVFDPSGISDAREYILSAIVRRRGQPSFRQHLLAAYHGQCAISVCDVEPVLEAAHIVPYLGPETNDLGNGLLLRADLHTLFDLKLIAIDIATMSLLVSPSLVGTCYEELRGRSIKVPEDPHSRPSRKALEQHRKESSL
jgi:HNH endonuclease